MDVEWRISGSVGVVGACHTPETAGRPTPGADGAFSGVKALRFERSGSRYEFEFEFEFANIWRWRRYGCFSIW